MTGSETPSETLSAAEMAYRFIRNAIVTGEIPQGDTLRETHLAEEIGVSRTPVREALGRLSNEGLVVLERHRRARVAQLSGEDTIEIFRLRAKVESHACRRAASRITDEAIQQLERIEDEMEARFAESGWHRHLAHFDRLNNEFHALIARYSESPRVERILAGSLELPASIFNRYSEPYEDRTRRTHRQHREIIDALRFRNPDWAEAAMSAHLLSVPKIGAGDEDWILPRAE